ncbi:MAG: hypothetical protein U0974_01195 [Gemmatimonadales bacterium]|nr:hypothetical protein [Gemmatimonadales bacterium]MDZ4388331.1 hypothetical protein [Gemmatimonadales bacterium]
MTRPPVTPLRIRAYPGPRRHPLGLALLLTRIAMRAGADGLVGSQAAQPPEEGELSSNPPPQRPP